MSVQALCLRSALPRRRPAVPTADRGQGAAGPDGAGGDLVRYSEHFEDGPALWRAACDIGAEGIVSKRRDAPYQSGRTKAWIKSKCTQRQEFVVAGYVPSNAVAHAIGSLVVGYHNDAGGPVHAGRVGTGCSTQLATELHQRLEAIRAPASPFAKRLARADARGVRFVCPELVAEVVFRGWSSDGLLRHVSFLALREDKRPDEVKRGWMWHMPPINTGARCYHR
jgi:bifunctional non-homologous end joining protein LigD